MKKLLLPIALLALMGQGCMSPAPAPRPAPMPPMNAPVPVPPPTPTPTPAPVPEPNVQGEIYNVEIKNMQFSPNNFTVKKGTRIVFVNRDTAPHTVTATGKEFDSGTMGSGKSYTLDTSSLATGSHPFFCNIHPGMTGTLIIRP